MLLLSAMIAVHAPAWQAPSLPAAAACKARGELATRIDRALGRLKQPPFTIPFILADVSFGEKRVFTEYSGDISGRMVGVAAAEAACGRPQSWELSALAAELKKYQKPDGHFGAPQELAKEIDGKRDMPILWGNGRLLVGLLEAYDATHDAASLDLAKKLGNYYVATDQLLDRAELVDKYGNYAAGFATCYFSGIEGLVGLNRVTKDARYLEQAQRMAALMARTTKAGEQHSHGRLCALRGLLDLYEATGDTSLLERVRAEHTTTLHDYVWPTGGMSEMSVRSFTRDEGCTEADWLRLNLQLWRLTGVDSYLELAEMTLANELAVNQFPNGGFGHHVALFRGGAMDGYGPVSTKGTEEAYWCCAEHGPRALLELPRYVVAQRGRDIYVNLYEACEVDLRVNNEPVHISIEPADHGQRVAVKVHTRRPVRMALRLRIPGWCQGFDVSGGPGKVDASGRFVAQGEFSGDTLLQVRLPFQVGVRSEADLLAWKPARELGEAKAASAYLGPYLLGRAVGDANEAPIATLSAGTVWDQITMQVPARVPGKGLLGSDTKLQPVGLYPPGTGFRVRVDVAP